MAYLAPTSDFVTSTLSGAIAAGDATATIGTGLDLPATNGILQIDYDSAVAVGADNGPETIAYATYTTGTGALAGMTRGLNGTTGVAHANAAKVQCGPSASYWGSGSILSADVGAVLLNANLATTAGEPGGAWKTWTPTFANFTKGSATISAYYTQIGKTIHYRISVILAADSSMGTAPTFTLPVTSIATPQVFAPIGLGLLFDANGQGYNAVAIWSTTTTATLKLISSAGTATYQVPVTASVPMTWTTSDAFYMTGTYEAA